MCGWYVVGQGIVEKAALDLESSDNRLARATCYIETNGAIVENCERQKAEEGAEEKEERAE